VPYDSVRLHPRKDLVSHPVAETGRHRNQALLDDNPHAATCPWTFVLPRLRSKVLESMTVVLSLIFHDDKLESTSLGGTQLHSRVATVLDHGCCKLLERFLVGRASLIENRSGHRTRPPIRQHGNWHKGTS
jgi:hypothetical protein